MVAHPNCSEVGIPCLNGDDYSAMLLNGQILVSGTADEVGMEVRQPSEKCLAQSAKNGISTHLRYGKVELTV